MPVTHFTKKLNGYHTRLLCGIPILHPRYFTQRDLTTTRTDVTCKKCLAKLTATEAR